MATLKQLFVKRKKLAEFGLLSRFSEEYLWQLAQNCQTVQLRKNVIIYNTLDNADSAYFIVRGDVELEKKNQQREKDYSVLYGYEKKYNNNGMKIRSYHGMQQLMPIIRVVSQGEYFGFQEQDLNNSQIVGKNTRNQIAKCKNLCVLYKIPLETLKMIYKLSGSKEKATQEKDCKGILIQKNFSLTKLQDWDGIERKKVKQKSFRMSVCKYNKASNLPLELKSQGLSLEPVDYIRNKSTMQYYENKRDSSFSMKLKPSKLQDQNSFLNSMLRGRAQRLLRKQGRLEDKSAHSKLKIKLL